MPNVENTIIGALGAIGLPILTGTITNRFAYNELIETYKAIPDGMIQGPLLFDNSPIMDLPHELRRRLTMPKLAGGAMGIAADIAATGIVLPLEPTTKAASIAIGVLGVIFGISISENAIKRVAEVTGAITDYLDNNPRVSLNNLISSMDHRENESTVNPGLSTNEPGLFSPATPNTLLPSGEKPINPMFLPQFSNSDIIPSLPHSRLTIGLPSVPINDHQPISNRKLLKK